MEAGGWFWLSGLPTGDSSFQSRESKTLTGTFPESLRNWPEEGGGRELYGAPRLSHLPHLLQVCGNLEHLTPTSNPGRVLMPRSVTLELRKAKRSPQGPTAMSGNSGLGPGLGSQCPCPLPEHPRKALFPRQEALGAFQHQPPRQQFRSTGNFLDEARDSLGVMPCRSLLVSCC